MANAFELDAPERFGEIRSRISEKYSLRALYAEAYQRYGDSLQGCAPGGLAIELGSGAGFVKELIPEMRTTDVIAYPGVDQVIDGTRMPYEAGSVRFIAMMNVLHHISDAEAFFREVSRVLKTGGRLLISDQYPGWIAGFVLKHVHHEGYDSQARDWRFVSQGPLSSANGALPWMIFFRDRSRFEKLFPELRIRRIERHTPLRYWLSGGLKTWTLLPRWAWGAASFLDSVLLKISPEFGSFMDIELEKVECSRA